MLRSSMAQPYGGAQRALMARSSWSCSMQRCYCVSTGASPTAHPRIIPTTGHSDAALAQNGRLVWPSIIPTEGEDLEAIRRQLQVATALGRRSQQWRPQGSFAAAGFAASACNQGRLQQALSGLAAPSLLRRAIHSTHSTRAHSTSSLQSTGASPAEEDVSDEKWSELLDTIGGMVATKNLPNAAGGWRDAFEHMPTHLQVRPCARMQPEPTFPLKPGQYKACETLLAAWQRDAEPACAMSTALGGARVHLPACLPATCAQHLQRLPLTPHSTAQHRHAPCYVDITRGGRRSVHAASPEEQAGQDRHTHERTHRAHGSWLRPRPVPCMHAARGP